MKIEVTSSVEENALEKLKKNAVELNQDEITLIRFLKARDFDVDRAEQMLRQCLNWRKEHDIDHILDWNPPQYLYDDLPYAIPGYDYEGGPVFCIPFGRWKHRSWVEQGYGDELLRWGYRLIEDGLQTLKKNKDGRYQCTAIFDLGNISYYQAAHIASLRVLYNGFKALEQNFPEVLKCVVVINAPWLFSIPFNFIKGIISPNTLSKLKVFDCNKKNWLKFLLDRCPQKSLPQEYFKDENGN